MLELTSSVKWINYWGRVLYDINNMLSLTLHGWHAILRAIINVQMSSRKKKRSCPFSLAKGRPKKVKNTFDEEWTAKLAESDKGSFNTKKNWWMNSITITKLKWAQVAVKYNCKKLSKQRKLTKRSGRSWKADQLFGMSLMSRRSEYYGKHAIAKWTWFIVDWLVYVTLPRLFIGF